MNVRDWIHVQDHCAAVVAALFEGEPGAVYNFGGGNEMANLDLVKMILKQLGKPESLISYVKDRPGHDRRYAIDSSFAQKQLKWKPRQDFKEGSRPRFSGTSTIRRGGSRCSSGLAGIKFVAAVYHRRKIMRC